MKNRSFLVSFSVSFLLLGLAMQQQVSAQTTVVRVRSLDPYAPVSQSSLDRANPPLPPRSYRYSAGPTHERVSETVSYTSTSRVVVQDARGREFGFVVQDRTTYTNSYSSSFPNRTHVGSVQERGTARAGTIYGNPPGVRVIGAVVTSAFARGKGK